MNMWLVATRVLMLCLVPCGVVCIRRSAADAVVALEAAATIAALVLLTLSLGADRSAYGIVAVVVAALDLAGGMAFARFLDGRG